MQENALFVFMKNRAVCSSFCIVRAENLQVRLNLLLVCYKNI